MLHLTLWKPNACCNFLICASKTNWGRKFQILLRMSQKSLITETNTSFTLYKSYVCNDNDTLTTSGFNCLKQGWSSRKINLTFYYLRHFILRRYIVEGERGGELCMHLYFYQTRNKILTIWGILFLCLCAPIFKYFFFIQFFQSFHDWCV